VPPQTAADPVADLREVLGRVMAEVVGGELSEKAQRFALEPPRQAEHGDLATNAAMLLSGAAKAPPRDVAQRLAEGLAAALGDRLTGTEVAGPGFLNLRLADAWYADALAAILGAGGFGGGGAATAERVQVEFVSANPTGPIHLGHARNAAYGDAVARILAFHGHEVQREYYVNDAGTQVQVFASSVQARARGEEVPEGGYPGAYVAEIAAAVQDAAGRDQADLAVDAVAAMLERIETTLAAFRIRFDSWFSEASLHPEAVARAVAVLREQGHAYEHDGALWLRTTDFGDEKDRVIIRSSGEHTYFASDIAYALAKQERGFDRFIYVLGADHHGYVARLKAAFRALGGDPAKLDVLIMQFVRLTGGASMSKRAGTFQTLDDLLDGVGADAARWFLLNRSHDTSIEFDLDLAVSQSNENPVFYVQYAHARIASILRKAGVATASAAEPAEALHPSERALVGQLAAFPDVVTAAADRREPHRVATYALELARSFSAFYRDCQVVGTAQEPFRLGLCVATKDVLARALDLLGVTAPDEM
jgi:arginyl-tRNA synthetase